MAGIQLRRRDQRDAAMSNLPGLPDDVATDDEQLSLVDLVDHVLNKGVVLAGEATIAIADIDLIYLGLNIVLTSVQTAEETMRKRAEKG